MTDTKDGLLVRKGEEVWETTVEGTIWYQVQDGRGGVKDLSVSGIGRKVRIKTEDRIINQETCVNPENDPFRNGAFVRKDADQSTDPMTASPDALSYDQMTELFNVTGPEFAKKIEPLNELSLRRLKAMAEAVDATASQIKKIDELLDTRYPIGGSMPIYDELRAIGQVHQGR